MKIFFLALFSIGCSLMLNGQRLAITDYSNRYEGLHTGAVDIFQDHNGWMWFATSTEVIRYDGNRFKTYHPSNGVKIDFCFRVFEIKNEIWVLSDPYSLKVKGDSLVPNTSLANEKNIGAAIVFKDENYFLTEGGLKLLKDKKLQSFIPIDLKSQPGDQLIAFNDSLLLGCILNKSLLVFNLNRRTVHILPWKVRSLKQDKKGHAYLMLLDEGLAQIKTIYQDGNTINVEKEILYRVLPTAGSDFIVDEQKNIWLFLQHKHLARIAPDKSIRLYNEGDGLPLLLFTDIFLDREQNIWIAFNGGLCKLAGRSIDRYTTRDGLPFNRTSFLAPSYDGKLAYAFSSEGMSVFKNNRWQPILKNGKPFICHWFVDRGDRQVYLRDSSLFEMVIDINTFSIKKERHLALLQGIITEFDIDRKGTIFIGGWNGVIAFFQDRLIQVLPAGMLIKSLRIDADDRLWVGGFGEGLEGYRISYKDNKPVLKRISFAEDVKKKVQPFPGVRSIHGAGKNNVLVGTRFDGLYSLNLRNDSVIQIHHVTEKDGLNSNAVWGITTGRSGKGWLATTKGVNSIERKGDSLVVRDEGKIYGIFRANAITYTNDSTVWVSSSPGIVAFKDKARALPVPFQVFITDITVNNSNKPDKNVKGAFRLSFLENNISIRFSSNSFINEEDMLYTYQLKAKRDTIWTEPTNEKQVNFSALEPGHYSFRVKAMNPGRELSTNEAGFNFHILPPFWQRWWFIMLVVIAASGALFSLYRYRIHQITQMQTIRNDISRDLHDDIGASLSNIHILNELTQKNLDDKPKAASYISRAGEAIQRINESLSDIVWNINPRYDNINHLLTRMKWYAAEMMDGKNIEAEINFPEPDHKLIMPMEQRRDFYLIFKEIINNLAKHSHATAASISLNINKDKIELMVEDNGVGFEMNAIKKGIGLESMRSRSAKWKTDLVIDSKPGKGTLTKLSMTI